MGYTRELKNILIKKAENSLNSLMSDFNGGNYNVKAIDENRRVFDVGKWAFFFKKEGIITEEDEMHILLKDDSVMNKAHHVYRKFTADDHRIAAIQSRSGGMYQGIENYCGADY